MNHAVRYIFDMAKHQEQYEKEVAEVGIDVYDARHSDDPQNYVFGAVARYQSFVANSSSILTNRQIERAIYSKPLQWMEKHVAGEEFSSAPARALVYTDQVVQAIVDSIARTPVPELSQEALELAKEAWAIQDDRLYIGFRGLSYNMDFVIEKVYGTRCGTSNVPMWILREGSIAFEVTMSCKRSGRPLKEVSV